MFLSLSQLRMLLLIFLLCCVSCFQCSINLIHLSLAVNIIPQQRDCGQDDCDRRSQVYDDVDALLDGFGLLCVRNIADCAECQDCGCFMYSEYQCLILFSSILFNKKTSIVAIL